MVPFETLQIAQIQIAKAKVPIAVVFRQLDRPCRNFFTLCIELALLAVTRLADPKGLARHPDTNAALLDCLDGHLRTSGVYGLTTFFLELPTRSRP